MSENKRYYWLKLKKDFFSQKMIKILRTFDEGDRMILTFLKIELHSLENDGYIYYENMLPTFEQELSIAIDEDTAIVKATLETLLRFGAIKKVDKNKYYITFIEDCIGSETKNASRMRKTRSAQCAPKSEHCAPEIEKETNIDIESDIEKKRKPSSFSGEKKGGRYGTKNNYSNKKGHFNNSSYDLSEIEKSIQTQELVYVPQSERNLENQ